MWPCGSFRMLAPVHALVDRQTGVGAGEVDLAQVVLADDLAAFAMIAGAALVVDLVARAESVTSLVHASAGVWRPSHAGPWKVVTNPVAHQPVAILVEHATADQLREYRSLGTVIIQARCACDMDISGQKNHSSARCQPGKEGAVYLRVGAPLVADIEHVHAIAPWCDALA